jgi:hypothetical protein
MTTSRSLRPFLLGLAVSGLGACATLGEILDHPPDPNPFARDRPEVAADESRAARAERDPLGAFHIVVDLDDNELRFMDGQEVLWSGPVGTGTGLRLAGAGTEWEFSTPNGLFHIQYKELNPVWILPDWYYVREELPIPPRDSPARRVPGALGAAAVYLSDEIAIHGTDKPELLGQRVSHGCIRLSDADAVRLFHNVQVGTPVLITGGRRAARTQEASRPTVPREQQARPTALARTATAQLLTRLDRELEAADTSRAWTETASELIRRGIDDDAIALRGLLARSGTAADDRSNREYSTFVADAFTRGSLRAVVSLARISEEARERASVAIVEGVMDLYGGALDGAGAPWPTRRVPEWRLGPEGTQGWQSLRSAEGAYRERPEGTRLVMGTNAR